MTHILDNASECNYFGDFCDGKCKRCSVCKEWVKSGNRGMECPGPPQMDAEMAASA